MWVRWTCAYEVDVFVSGVESFAAVLHVGGRSGNVGGEGYTMEMFVGRDGHVGVDEVSMLVWRGGYVGWEGWTCWWGRRELVGSLRGCTIWKGRVFCTCCSKGADMFV